MCYFTYTNLSWHMYSTYKKRLISPCKRKREREKENEREREMEPQQIVSTVVQNPWTVRMYSTYKIWRASPCVGGREREREKRRKTELHQIDSTVVKNCWTRRKVMNCSTRSFSIEKLRVKEWLKSTPPPICGESRYTCSHKGRIYLVRREHGEDLMCRPARSKTVAYINESCHMYEWVSSHIQHL